MPSGNVRRPGVGGALEGLVPVGDGVHTPLPHVPRNGLVNITVAERFKGLALVRVALATVLAEVVHGAGVTLHEGPRAPLRGRPRAVVSGLR